MLYKYDTYYTKDSYTPFKLIGYNETTDKVILRLTDRIKEYTISKKRDSLFFTFRNKQYSLDDFRFKKA